jgi:hypothetical protein
MKDELQPPRENDVVVGDKLVNIVFKHRFDAVPRMMKGSVVLSIV